MKKEVNLCKEFKNLSDIAVIEQKLFELQLTDFIKKNEKILEKYGLNSDFLLFFREINDKLIEISLKMEKKYEKIERKMLKSSENYMDYNET